MTPAGARRPWSLVVCVVLTILYLLTAARHVLTGDNAEFVTVGFDGGVAHPSGYPLLVLWIRLFRWLPASTPAHAAAMATALTGGLALVTLTRAVRAWGASEVGAGLAAAMFGASSLAARLSTAAEVFVLNAALVGAIVWVAAPRGPLAGVRRASALALLAGLALSNHLSAVLVAPIGLYGAYVGLRESERPPRALVLALVLFVAGLSPYLLLISDARGASPGTLAWGDTTTIAGLWRHFTRADYGSVSFGASGAAHPLENEAFLARSLVSQTHGFPVLLALVGGWYLVRPAASSRLAGVLLVASGLLAGPFLVARFNVALRALGPLVVERLHVLPLYLLCLLAGLGASVIIERAPILARFGAALVALVLVADAAFAMPDVAEEHTATVENYLRDTLASLPERSILIGTGDHRNCGFAYVQRVLGERRDVDYIDARLTPYAWYRRKLTARGVLGPEPADAGIIDPRVLAARALATGRAVFVTDLSIPPILASFPTYPFGTALRVLPRDATVPATQQIEAMNAALLPALHASAPAPRDSWAQGTRSDYERTWVMIAEAYEREGDRDAAQRNWARAEAFAPAR